jgi:hypothetical protein
MKILTKIKRRNNGDALPHRGEYVEMDLFDTDRNPLDLTPPAPSGGSLPSGPEMFCLVPTAVHGGTNPIPGWLDYFPEHPLPSCLGLNGGRIEAQVTCYVDATLYIVGKSVSGQVPQAFATVDFEPWPSPGQSLSDAAASSTGVTIERTIPIKIYLQQWSIGFVVKLFGMTFDFVVDNSTVMLYGGVYTLPPYAGAT